MKTITRECTFCGSVEGLKRPVGNYIVELKQLKVDETTNLACQSCYISFKRDSSSVVRKELKMRDRLIEQLKKIF